MKMSSQTNRALYKFFKEASNECNDRGVGQKMILDAMQGYTVPTTEHFLKDAWKAVQKTMYGTTSIADLEQDQVTPIYDVLNLLFGEEFGVHQAFPSMDAVAFASLTEEHG